MKYLKFILILLFIECFFAADCRDYNYVNKKTLAKDSTYTDSSRLLKSFDTLWLAAVGDLMCHSQQFNEAVTDNGFDFKYVYTAIKPYLSEVDIAFGNLETVTAGIEQRFTGYPMFNTPVEYIEALKHAGFDVITTANNHSLDRSFSGIEKTLDVLDRNELLHTGTYSSEEETRNNLIINLKGIKLGILAYTYGTNGIQPQRGKEFSVNYIDESAMQEDIYTIKQSGVDKIIIFLHWGEEYQREPNSYQKRIADFLFEKGADIIFGSHPHVIQTMELKTITGEDGKSKEVFIIYSMGNFISNQRKKYTDSGVIVRVKLIKNVQSGETNFGEIDFVPTYVSTNNGFHILPVSVSINAIENKITDSQYYFPGDYQKLKEVWEETTNQLSIPEKNIYPAEN